MSRLGSIYLITCISNNRSYIGQTLQNPFRRFQDHYREALNEGSTSPSPLYRDMYKLGISSFSFKIIETDIPEDLLDKKEIAYIAKFVSFIDDEGYNLTRGGQQERSSKLKYDEVLEIIEAIKNGVDFKILSEKYGVCYSTISDINCGDTWHMANEHYPIRGQRNKKKNYSADIIDEIYSKLRDNVSYSSIAKEYDTSVQTISKIDKGLIYFRSTETYPISTKIRCRTNITDTILIGIVSDLEDTDLTYNDIARKYSVDRHTVSSINNGTRYKNRLMSVTSVEYFPIRF